MRELWLMRHGETAWSLSGAHTGKTDVALTARGEDQARAVRSQLQSQTFAAVLTSPLTRARETCRLAGLADNARVCDDLREWDYGDFEGRTSQQIRVDYPDWSIWTGPVPGGERIEQVAARARRALELAGAYDGPVAVFAHGHILRVLAACWLGLSPDSGKLFGLSTGSVSLLGYEHETRVLSRWNQVPA